MHFMPLTIIDWGSVADWVSGLGSLAAAIVALYVARFSQRVKLRGYCGKRIILTEGGAEPNIDAFAIYAINTSMRPTTITHIGLVCGFWRWKQHASVRFMRDIGSILPTPLSDGQYGEWYVPMRESNNFARDLVDKLQLTRLSAPTLRVQILTSNGDTTTLWPEMGFIKLLLSLVKEKNAPKALTE
jgi:hypothetical protein